MSKAKTQGTSTHTRKAKTGDSQSKNKQAGVKNAKEKPAHPVPDAESQDSAKPDAEASQPVAEPDNSPVIDQPLPKEEPQPTPNLPAVVDAKHNQQPGWLRNYLEGTDLPPTLEIASELVDLFEVLNNSFCDGRIGPTVVTYAARRKDTFFGYFVPNRYVNHKTGEAIHEIAVHPEAMHKQIKAVTDRADNPLSWAEAKREAHKRLLSTFVHELKHAEHHQDYIDSKCGIISKEVKKPSANGRHSAYWYDLMVKCGLQPIGKKGREKKHISGESKVTHEIVTGGKFDTLYEEFLKDYDLSFEAIPENVQTSTVRKPDQVYVLIDSQGQEVKLRGKPGLVFFGADGAPAKPEKSELEPQEAVNERGQLSSQKLQHKETA